MVQQPFFTIIILGPNKKGHLVQLMFPVIGVPILASISIG